MFCNQCGSRINENFRFCSVCGAQVEKLETLRADYEPPKLPQQAKKLVPVWLIVLAMFLNLPAGIAAMICHGRAQTSTEPGDAGFYDKGSIAFIIGAGALFAFSIIMYLAS